MSVGQINSETTQFFHPNIITICSIISVSIIKVKCYGGLIWVNWDHSLGKLLFHIYLCSSSGHQQKLFDSTILQFTGWWITIILIFFFLKKKKRFVILDLLFWIIYF